MKWRAWWLACAVTAGLYGCPDGSAPGGGGPEPQPPPVLPVSTAPPATVRHRDRIDLDALPDETRLEVETLMEAARDQRRKAAELLGEAVEIERQARAAQTAGDKQAAAGATEQAAHKRQLAKSELVKARAFEAQAKELASAAAAATR